MAKKAKVKASATNGEVAPQQLVKTIRLDFKLPPGQPSVFANHMVVQSDSTMVYLAFFEAMPPLLIGSEQEIQAQAEQIHSVTPSCVGRIAIPANRITDFAGALAGIAAKFAEQSTEKE
jgi:hypothetical protein